MADIREMLARLNPTNVKFDVGRGGGAPELTAQDIAAAIAFIPQGLAREVFVRLWWPDGARLSSHELDRAISNLVHAEAARRHRKLQMARIELHMAEEEAHRRRVSTDDSRREISRLKVKASEAKARTWPYHPGMHVTIREAVLGELARPNHCPICSGRGTVMVLNLVKVCTTCSGSGIVPVSDRGRAARVGRDESSYRTTWKGLYEWLFDQLRDAEASAASRFAQALRRVDMEGAA